MRSVFGSRNDRLLKRMQKTVETINEIEPKMAALSDEQLRAETTEFKSRISKGETLEDLLPDSVRLLLPWPILQAVGIALHCLQVLLYQAQLVAYRARAYPVGRGHALPYKRPLKTPGHPGLDPLRLS